MKYAWLYWTFLSISNLEWASTILSCMLILKMILINVVIMIPTILSSHTHMVFKVIEKMLLHKPFFMVYFKSQTLFTLTEKLSLSRRNWSNCAKVSLSPRGRCMQCILHLTHISCLFCVFLSPYVTSHFMVCVYSISVSLYLSTSTVRLVFFMTVCQLVCVITHFCISTCMSRCLSLCLPACCCAGSI